MTCSLRGGGGILFSKGFFYVIGDYSVMFLLRKKTLREDATCKDAGVKKQI